jgi:D-alanyl-D-alanine carboxypeptidase (penicillin-binding protein 5/6)
MKWIRELENCKTTVSYKTIENCKTTGSHKTIENCKIIRKQNNSRWRSFFRGSLKNICIILLIQLVQICVWQMCMLSAQAEEEDTPGSLYAQSAVLMDADSGRILYEKNGYEVRAMASTTKIMTCILALEHMETDQIAVVSDYAASQPKVKLGMLASEKYYLNDLLYSLMLESHNDTAVAVAESVAGSVSEFASLMNQKAQEIGCMDTHFVTPYGLDASDDGGAHATTAADLARILRYCIMESPQKDAFLEITRTRTYAFSDIDGKRQYSCYNHNAFLDMMEGALTGKTGFTGTAGYCYVGAVQQEERTFIVALLACGWPNNKNYKWSDMKTLMEYAFANYHYQNIWQNVELPELTVANGVDTTQPYQIGTKISLHIKGTYDELKMLLGAQDAVTLKHDIAETLVAPVQQGEVVGTVRYMLNGEEVASYDIVTDQEVLPRTYRWCMQFMLYKILL